MKKTQLNWGFLGAAKIGRSLAPAIVASKYARAYAVASRSREKAEAYAHDNGFERSYASYQALLKDPKVDVIYNPLPNHLHCEWTIRALEAGKHVLCEKPMALKATECRRMIAAAKRNRRLLMEAFMYRFHPQTLKLQEIIRRGVIGEVRVIRAGFGFSLNESATNVRLGRRMGGGCLWDVGCYCVNAMRTFFGDEPEQVAGQAKRGKVSGVDMTFGAVLMFPEGRMGVFTSSFQTVLDWGVEIIGTLGRISVPSPWKPYARLASFVLDANGKREVIQVKNGGGIYHCEVDHFSRCILQKKPLAWPPEEGLKNVRVIEALYDSARRGRVVRVK